MNLRYLRTFVEVGSSTSLTEAAQRLGITQSAVSLQLQKLEAEFGARLVDRTRTPLVLTPAGEALLEESAALLQGYEAAHDAVQRASTEVAGRLRISASSIPGEHLVPRLLVRFQREHPAVRAWVSVSDTAGVYRDLLRGGVDFGFVGARREDLGLAHEAFADDEIILVGPGGAEPVAIKPEGLLAVPLIMREEGSGTLASAMRSLEAAGVRPARLSTIMTLGSTQAVLTAVRAGAGYALVSRRAADDLLALGVISAIEVEGLKIRRTLWTAYDPSRAEGGLRESFLQAVRAWKTDQPAVPST